MSCEISPDRTWRDQWHCTTHSVWFRDSGQPSTCPAGDAYNDALDEALYACRGCEYAEQCEDAIKALKEDP